MIITQLPHTASPPLYPGAVSLLDLGIIRGRIKHVLFEGEHDLASSPPSVIILVAIIWPGGGRGQGGDV